MSDYHRSTFHAPECTKFGKPHFALAGGLIIHQNWVLNFGFYPETQPRWRLDYFGQLAIDPTLDDRR